MIYKGYNVKWEQRPRVAALVDPLFDGIESSKDSWDHLHRTINRYLSFDQETQANVERSLRRYLISRDAHKAFRSRPDESNYEAESFEFWVLLRMHLEWNEAENIISNLPLEYAHRYLAEIAPDLSYAQKKDDVKIISKITGIDIPYEILLKLVAST